MYVTLQSSTFASHCLCSHFFDTGKCTEEYRIYKCFLYLKITYVSVIGVHMWYAQAHPNFSKTTEDWYFGRCGYGVVRTDTSNYVFLLKGLMLGTCFKDKWEHICHSCDVIVSSWSIWWNPFQVYNHKNNNALPYSIDELGSIEFTTTPYAWQEWGAR